jgi:hypothetical protein
MRSIVSNVWVVRTDSPSGLLLVIVSCLCFSAEISPSSFRLLRLANGTTNVINSKGDIVKSVAEPLRISDERYSKDGKVALKRSPRTHPITGRPVLL